MKISKLTLKNFQSHKDSVLEFDKGFSTISGPSNSGKSSVLRSLDCILFRKKFYLRDGCNSGEIVIETDDGNKITRQKSLKGSVINEKYILNGTQFRKVGKNVPEEILKVTNIREVELSDGDTIQINYADQHGGKFLLSDGAYSEAYRGRVTSLKSASQLDRASLEAASEHRQVKSQLTNCLDHELPNLETKVSELGNVESLLESYKRLRERKQSIDRLIEQDEYLTHVHNTMREFSKTKPVDKSILISKLKSVLESLQCLSLLNKIQKIKVNEVKITFPNFNNIDKYYSIYESFEDLDFLDDSLEKWSYCLELDKSMIHDLQGEHNKLIGSIEICPLCERKLK